jgi:diaminopimelate epimerase
MQREKPHFFKYTALGNDYIVIDPVNCPIALSPEAIRLICDRNHGIGSDGILHGPFIEQGRTTLRIFNPDGSEAEKSGNGVRIFSRFLFERGYNRSKEFSFETKGGPVGIEILDDPGQSIRVNMGAFSFRSDRIPVNGPSREVVNEELFLGGISLRITCVTVGNPHCVIPFLNATKETALSLGPRIEHHPLFPNRTNVQLLSVIDRGAIRIEIWERGAGYTLASGSSSCAAACAARRLGLVDDEVDVHMPGGVLRIAIKGNEVFMTGPVASVCEGFFTEEFLGKLEE